MREITTRLVPAVVGGYQLLGEKCWISRLDEAAVFVVFAKDPADRLAKRDLNGLLYADGMHDSLYRSSGRSLLAMPVRDDGADVTDTRRIEGQRGA